MIIFIIIDDRMVISRLRFKYSLSGIYGVMLFPHGYRLPDEVVLGEAVIVESGNRAGIGLNNPSPIIIIKGHMLFQFGII